MVRGSSYLISVNSERFGWFCILGGILRWVWVWLWFFLEGCILSGCSCYSSSTRRIVLLVHVPVSVLVQVLVARQWWLQWQQQHFELAAIKTATINRRWHKWQKSTGDRISKQEPAVTKAQWITETGTLSSLSLSPFGCMHRSHPLPSPLPCHP